MVVEIRDLKSPEERMGFVWLPAFPKQDTVLDFMGDKMLVQAVGMPHLKMCDEYITALNSGVHEHEERTPIIFITRL